MLMADQHLSEKHENTWQICLYFIIFKVYKAISDSLENHKIMKGKLHYKTLNGFCEYAKTSTIL